jgi:hypothetical protein
MQGHEVVPQIMFSKMKRSRTSRGIRNVLYCRLNLLSGVPRSITPLIVLNFLITVSVLTFNMALTSMGVKNSEIIVVLISWSLPDFLVGKQKKSPHKWRWFAAIHEGIFFVGLCGA